MQIIALNNQTLSDIAVRHCGTIEAVADIAILNNISITDNPAPGQIITLPNKDYGYQEVINYFRENKTDPATALTDEHTDTIAPLTGIDYWIIENDFIVQ